MKLKGVLGVILATLTSLSALLAIAGIWGVVEGETVGQLISTFLVLGLATWLVSYVSNSFFIDK